MEQPRLAPLPNMRYAFVFVAILFALEIAYLLLKTTALQAMFTVLSIVGLIWWLSVVGQIHVVLRQVTQDSYPTSPRQAALFHLIPLFNLAWVFIWMNRVVDFLNQRSSARRERKWWLGFALLLSILLARLDLAIGLAATFSVLFYVTHRVRHAISASA